MAKYTSYKNLRARLTAWLVARGAVEIEPEEMLVVRIPVGTARAFAKRTLEVVGAGRPICAVCGTPIDPDGHVHVLPDDL